MNSYLPSYFMVTGWLCITISLRRLITRHVSYKAGGVTHDQKDDMTWNNLESLISGYILMGESKKLGPLQGDVGNIHQVKTQSWKNQDHDLGLGC